MAVHGGAETTLADFGMEDSCEAHEPVLHARDRAVRCERCGRTVPVTVVAEYTLRDALAELADAPCRDDRIPAAAGGEHTLRLGRSTHDGGQRVVCETCGRSAPLQGDGSRALHALAEIPCAEGWSYRELLDAVLGPTPATPPLSALGVQSWRGVETEGHGDDTVRLLRHGGFQYTLYVARTDDGDAVEGRTPAADRHYEVTLRTGPSTDHEPIESVSLPGVDATDPTAQARAERLVTFLAATDDLGAGEFAAMVDHHASADAAHRESWLDEAYAAARETFQERVGGSPEAFAETFADADDTREVLRRVVDGDDFEDADESTFATAQAGERPHFPDLFEYVTERYGWRPPTADR